MAILLIGVPLDIGQPLIARLVEQGDEVRVLEQEAEREPVWRELGAFVAAGEWEEDLVERAAQNVRTVVIFDGPPGIEPWLLEQLLTGARIARVDRLVWVAPALRRDDLAVINRSEMQYVALATGNRGLLRKRAAIAPDDIAMAIDAADDIAGTPRLELDLTKRRSWDELKLEGHGSGA